MWWEHSQGRFVPRGLMKVVFNHAKWAEYCPTVFTLQGAWSNRFVNTSFSGAVVSGARKPMPLDTWTREWQAGDLSFVAGTHCEKMASFYWLWGWEQVTLNWEAMDSECFFFFLVVTIWHYGQDQWTRDWVCTRSCPLLGDVVIFCSTVP